MEVTAPRPITYNRWLPYWAVFQADMTQTVRSWVYRFWVMVSVLAMVAYLFYRLGPYKELGIVQPASAYVSDLLRWLILGSITLVVVLAVGSISSERGTVADSVLSRGISRYQYFLGKWHSRLTVVLVTYLLLALSALLLSIFMLHEDISTKGFILAVLTVGALLLLVTSAGVAVSAVTNSTMMGIALLWMLLYGGGFALTLFPGALPSPDRVLQSLPYILRGYYDTALLTELIVWAVLLSSAMSVIGMTYFSRRDV